MPSTYTDTFGQIKIRLPQDCAHPSPNPAYIFPDRAKRDIITQKISSTVVETMRVANDPAGNQPTDWVLELHLDRTCLYVDVHCVMRSAYDALMWRTQQFNLDSFRRNVEESIHVALDKWAIQEYDVIVHCDDRRVWTQ